MELNHANKYGVDQGALVDHYFDLEESTSSDKNTFEIRCAIEANVIQSNEYIYAEGTSYGGIVDSVKIDTKKGVVYHKGRNWRGILGSKIISPDSGSDYYVVSGDLNTILGQLISKIDLADFFVAESTECGISSSFKFRYVDAHTGIIKMFSQVGAKLHIEWKRGKVTLSAIPIVDFSKEKEVSSDLFDFVIELASHQTNHIIGLGKGELSERQVIHKYIDLNGNVSDTQAFTGIDEICKTYEYSNCESLEDLEEKTIETLLEEHIDAKLKITAYDLNADIGDKFTATEINTGISVTQYVVDKIVTIENGVLKINYKVGDTL